MPAGVAWVTLVVVTIPVDLPAKWAHFRMDSSLEFLEVLQSTPFPSRPFYFVIYLKCDEDKIYDKSLPITPIRVFTPLMDI